MKKTLCLTQARRQDSVNGGAKINFGGVREVYFVWIREGHGGTSNLSQSGSSEQGEEQRFKGIFRPKSEIQAVFPTENRWSPKKKKKRSSFQKLHEIRCQSTKITNLGLDLHSRSPEPVNFFGAQSSLGGEAEFLLGGGTSCQLGGTAPVCPSMALGLASPTKSLTARHWPELAK